MWFIFSKKRAYLAKEKNNILLSSYEKETKEKAYQLDILKFILFLLHLLIVNVGPYANLW